MNDTSTGSIFTKALEDSLTRIFLLKPDELGILDLNGIRDLMNRIAPELHCEAVYFDNSLYKGISVVPTYEEVGNIGRYLFNFEDKDVKYTPNNYVVSISPKLEYSDIKEVVARILIGLDSIACNMKLNKIKACLMDKAFETHTLGSDKLFTFKNGLPYNSNCTPIILPFIINLYESDADNFNKHVLLKYFFEDTLQQEFNPYLIKYGYMSYAPDNNDEDDKHKKEVEMIGLFNSMWDALFNYPLNKGKIISQYEAVINNSTSGQYEKYLANIAKVTLEKSSSSILDPSLAEESLNESVKSFLEIKKTGMSELELSELEVEIEAATDTNDKMYIITRIHKDIATAVKAKKKIKNETELESIDSYILSLRELLNKLKNKKVRNDIDNIQVIVKYPKGDYEE